MPSSAAPTGRLAARSSLERLAELPPALRRLVVQRLADRAAGRPVPGAANHADEVAALRRTGTAMLDLGGGVRAVVEPRRPPRRALADPPTAVGGCGLSRLRRVTDSAIGETLVSSEDLQRRVAELGRQISEEYEGRDLFMVGVLKGAVLFLADLMRNISVPCEIDFMAVSSYGSQTDSSGVVRIMKDLDAPIEGRHVLIVEDIIDSGLTLQYLMRNLNARNPASLEVCFAADQARAPAGRSLAPLRRLRDPRSLRDRLRPRPRAALPQPLLRGRVERVDAETALVR